VPVDGSGDDDDEQSGDGDDDEASGGTVNYMLTHFCPIYL